MDQSQKQECANNNKGVTVLCSEYIKYIDKVIRKPKCYPQKVDIFLGTFLPLTNVIEPDNLS